jgi:hypothetical protein
LEQRIEKEERIVADMRKHGVEALELLLPYLQHPDADIRIKVAESYAHYPAKAEVLIPAHSREASDTDKSSCVSDRAENLRGRMKEQKGRYTVRAAPRTAARAAGRIAAHSA